MLQQFADAAALGRMVTEQDVANAALFLASDLSAGMTGVLVPSMPGLTEIRMGCYEAAGMIEESSNWPGRQSC